MSNKTSAALSETPASIKPVAMMSEAAVDIHGDAGKHHNQHGRQAMPSLGEKTIRL